MLSHYFGGLMKLKSLRYSKGWIVLLTTVIGICFGSYTFIHDAVATQVYVTNCGSVDYKPTVLIKFCADAGVQISQIEWDAWGANVAIGVGIYEINDCEPSCVAGTIHYADVKITLSKSKEINGKETLTFITVTTQDGKNLPLNDSPKDAWPLELAG